MLDVNKICTMMDSWLLLVAPATDHHDRRIATLKALTTELRHLQDQNQQEKVLEEMQAVIGSGMGSMYDLAPVVPQDVENSIAAS